MEHTPTTAGAINIVDPSANLGDGVQLDGFCVIQAGAKIGPGCKIGLYTVIGAGAVIGARTVIGTHCNIAGGCEMGEDNEIQNFVELTSGIRMGNKNRILSHVVLGKEPQSYAETPTITGKVEIGNECTVREYVTIHQPYGERGVTAIGDHAYLMNFTHMGHDVRLDENVTLTPTVVLAGFVRAMKGVNFGMGASVHQFTTLGSGCMVGMNAVVSRDVLPHTIYMMRNGRYLMSGVNKIALMRSGRSAEDVAALEEFYRDTFDFSLSTSISEQIAALGDAPWFAEDMLAFEEARKEQVRERPIAAWWKPDAE